MTNELLEIENVPFLKVKHGKEEILFYPDLVDVRELQERGLKKPTLSELVSLMYAGFSSSKNNDYVKNLKYYLFSESTSLFSSTYCYTHLPCSGGIIFDNLQSDKEGNPLIDYKRLLTYDLFYETGVVRVFKDPPQYKENQKKFAKLLIGEEGFSKLEDKSFFENGWSIDIYNYNNRKFEDKEIVLCASLMYSKAKKALIWLEDCPVNGQTFGIYKIK